MFCFAITWGNFFTDCWMLLEIKVYQPDFLDTGCPKSQTSFSFLPFSQTKFIQNANVGGVLKNSGNLLHDKHKNFENRFRNSWDNWGQSCLLSQRYFFLTLCNSKISISKMRGGNFVINYLSYFWINFQNSCAYHVANFLNFSKLPQLLHFGWTLSEKMARTKSRLTYGTPCNFTGFT